MKRKIFILINMFFLVSGVFAEKTPVKNLFIYKLNNGLDLYVAENHTVPLVYIEIAVKTGGISQTPENAGLFHLYEHMLFKGNKKYSSSEAMNDEMAALGVSSHNGGTSDECVNYYFTVPSNKLEEGLKFWSYAIRDPNLDKRELESEKKVVLSEILGRASMPQSIQYRALLMNLFPENPWKGDPGGNPTVVENATVSQLKKIQNTYYIPNNSALFVGGDVDPDEVYKLVNKIYGSWKKGSDPWKKDNNQYNTNPLSKDVFYVFANEQMSNEMASINISYRGPDAEYNENDTYPADLLFTCVTNPSSYYIQSLVNNPNLSIPDNRYTSIYYQTKRKLGVIEAYANILQPTQYITERVQVFADQIPLLLEKTVENVDDEYLAQVETVKKRMINQDLYSQETAENLLSQVQYWWIHDTVDYYFTYSENVSNSSNEDIKKFLNTYIIDKPRMIVLVVSPDVLNEKKDELEKAGYQILTNENTNFYEKK